MDKSKRAEAAEAAILAYLGGKPCAGEVPHGAKLIPEDLRPELVAIFADHGLSLKFAKHEDDALAVASLTAVEA